MSALSSILRCGDYWNMSNGVGIVHTKVKKYLDEVKHLRYLVGKGHKEESAAKQKALCMAMREELNTELKAKAKELRELADKLELEAESLPCW